jgi:dihydrofolate reductase
MRKLKLQVQMSVDGYIAGPQGEMDWMVWDWDDDLKSYVTGFTAPVDCILLGRNLAEGFIRAWTSQVQDPATADDFAHKMVDSPKIVFSKTLERVEWDNTTLASGDLVAEVNKLKNQAGGDLVAYGGATFVSSLIQAGLIDEYHLFINPVALGEGMTIFKGLHQRQNLSLVKSSAFDCGIVVLHYEPRQQQAG